jgi:hypothetical protein
MKNCGFLQTEAFRSEKPTETSNYSTEVSVETTKHSNQSQEARSFVYVENYKFYPKLRFSPASTLSHTQLKKNEKKNSKLYQVSRKQNQLFHGFNSESTSETSGHEFALNF